MKNARRNWQRKRSKRRRGRENLRKRKNLLKKKRTLLFRKINSFKLFLNQNNLYYRVNSPEDYVQEIMKRMIRSLKVWICLMMICLSWSLFFSSRQAIISLCSFMTDSK